MSNKDAIEKIESKLASGEIAPDYHVRQAIVNRYAENHGGLQLVGGVLVAVVGFSLVGWMGGVGIGLIAAQHLMNWHKKRSEDWRSIDAGRYGHLLTATEAKHYERIYGKGSLQAAKQGDYSHAGIESEDAIPSGSAGAIDVPAEPVEDTAKKADATVEPTPDTAVAPDESAPVEATSADAAIEGEAASADTESSTPTPIATPEPTDDRFAWAKDLLHFPAVLVWGAQGSGKTSFAAWLLDQRIKAGHSARVFDPHASYGQWSGLKVIGAGMNFSACDIAMQDFIAKVKQEYQARSKQPDYKPTRETVLVDEFTQWAQMCSHSSDFFVTALSDIRKIQKGVIFISHDRSLAGLGGAKGFSQARDNGLAELHLYSIVDPATGEPRPAMKGKLKIPGKGAIEVEISPEMNGSALFMQAVQSGSTPVQDLNQNGSDSVQAGSDGSDLNSGSNPVQWLNRCLDADSSELNQNGSEFSSSGSDVVQGGSGTFTAENLDSVQAVQRITELQAAGLNQTQIILALWRAKKGGSQAYTDAVNQYKLLMNESN